MNTRIDTKFEVIVVSCRGVLIFTGHWQGHNNWTPGISNLFYHGDTKLITDNQYLDWYNCAGDFLVEYN